MGYTIGAKTLPDLIDEIAGNLINSVDPLDGLSHWSDADPVWNTSIKTAMNARRALKYTKGTEVMYMALEVRNTWYTPYPGHAAKGLRVTFSESFDSVNHLYPVINQQTSIPFEDYSGIAQPPSDLASLMLTYYLWVESNGFVLMAKPEPSGANYQNAFFMAVERNPNKFYVNPAMYSNFYCLSQMNIWATFSGAVGAPDKHYGMLRPFAYTWPNSGNRTEGANYYCMTQGNFDRSYAFKSAGNGKVYYVKPVIFDTALEPATANFPPSPIFQADLWFAWSENMGLIDGDVVAIEGKTTKFLVKALDSPDSTNRLLFAMKYVA